MPLNPLLLKNKPQNCYFWGLKMPFLGNGCPLQFHKSYPSSTFYPDNDTNFWFPACKVYSSAIQTMYNMISSLFDDMISPLLNEEHVYHEFRKSSKYHLG